MKRAFLLATATAIGLAGFIQTEVRSLQAGTEPSVALTGQVTSAAEGSMEGVLVSAKKVGSTITITVVTDDQGRYRFPSAKLQAGEYSLRIRAVGYDLESPASV